MNLIDQRIATPPPPVVIRLARQAMGTRFEFVLVGDDEPHLLAVGEEALEEIAYLSDKFSYFSPASIVTKINQRAAVEPVGVDRETFSLLSLCRDVWEQSEGAFDITIAPLMHRLGFRDGLALKRQSDAADPVGMQHVDLDSDARTVSFRKAGIAIDLGAIAKGYALDRAAGICREHGVTCALLHGGTSTVVAIGSPPTDTRGWGVRIHDEHEPRIVHLRDAALSVSAQRGRMVCDGDATHGHIIDPRTGTSARTAATAAVIADEAVLADAWSTAMLIAQAAPSDFPTARAAIGIRQWATGNGQWQCTELHPMPSVDC